MSRFMKILSFICLGSMICGAIEIADRLPTDAGEYIEKKYAGWNGVLRGWVCSDWSCGGSFISWLNSAAAEFEKQHEGVYIEFESVSKEALAAEGISAPDMMIFSDGMISMDADTIALGGYMLVENPDAAGCAIMEEHAAAYIAMYQEINSAPPDSGIDLGLAAMSPLETVEIDPEAFRRFMNGELGRTIVNQAQLAKLQALGESGRGPDWKWVPRGGYNWCDQRLMLGVCAAGERRELCEGFLNLLLADDQQAGLSSIGAFAATGISVHGSMSPCRDMERQLHAAKAFFPKSEHSPGFAAGLVRKLSRGQIAAEEAARILMQTYS